MADDIRVAPSSEPSIPADLVGPLKLAQGYADAGLSGLSIDPTWVVFQIRRIGCAEDAFMAAGRLRSFFYVKWELAHGPDACKHGIAKAFSCRDCDEATVEAYYAALAAPSGVKPKEKV